MHSISTILYVHTKLSPLYTVFSWFYLNQILQFSPDMAIYAGVYSLVTITKVRRTLASPYTLSVVGRLRESRYRWPQGWGRHSPPPSIAAVCYWWVADGGGPEWPPTDMGWDTSVADIGPTRPPFVFRHPSPLRPAARLFGLSIIPFPFPVISTHSLGYQGRPAGRQTLSYWPYLRWYGSERSTDLQYVSDTLLAR